MMTDRDPLEQIGKLRLRVKELEMQRAEAEAGLRCIASFQHDLDLLWWQKKARETLQLMGALKGDDQ
jgi:hypothetical protein